MANPRSRSVRAKKAVKAAGQKHARTRQKTSRVIRGVTVRKTSSRTPARRN